MIKRIFVLLVFAIAFWLSRTSARAQQCAPTRVINDWLCTGGTTSCGDGDWRCGPTGPSCGGEQDPPCASGSCTFVCTNPINIAGTCQVTAQVVACQQSNCTANGVFFTGCNSGGGGVGSFCTLLGQTAQTYQCYINTGPTPSGGGGGGGCSSAWCAGADQCFASGGTQGPPDGCSPGLNQCCTSGGGGGGGPAVDPCPSDTCPGYCCNANCGDPCLFDADCKQLVDGNQNVKCLWMDTGRRCVNQQCPNNTIPGTICGCSGGIQCGQSCAGGCTGASSCTFVNAPGGNCSPGITQTACIGYDPSDQTKTVNPAIDRPLCYSGDTGNRMLRWVSNGATSPFTQNDIDSTCPCEEPAAVTAALTTMDGTPLNGATINALNVFTYNYDGYSSGMEKLPVTSYSAAVKWGTHVGGFGDVPEYTVSYPYTYDIEIVPEGGDCSSPAADCRYNTNLKYDQYTFAPKAPKLQMRIRNYKQYCDLAGPWTPWYHFTVTGMNFLTGTVFSDPTGQAVLSGNRCVIGTEFVFDQLGTGSPILAALVVDKPGMYGEYFNAYPTGYGPASSDNQVGYALLSGTPRTRWDTDMKWNQYHGFLNQLGTQDGPGWSARWTGTVTPSFYEPWGYPCADGPKCWGFDFNWAMWTYWGAYGGMRVYIDNNLVLNCWPMYPAGNVCFGAVALAQHRKYQIKIEMYQISYNSDFYLGYPGGAYKYYQPPTGFGFQPGSGSMVNTQDAAASASVPVAANGAFAQNSTAVANGTVTLVPNGYACTCPAGCTYGGISTPALGLNYFVSVVGTNWYQVMGGDVMALPKAGITFRDPITAQCTSPACSPFPIIAPPGGGNSQIGALMTVKGSSVDISDQSGTQNSPVGPTGFDFPVKLTDTVACKENYDYFYRLYSMGTAPQDDFVAPANNPAGAHKPDVAPVNNNVDGTTKGAYFHQGDLTIDQDWTLLPGESIVVFVNGTLNVTNNAKITVPTTSFLSFIVSGGVIFDPTIGTDDETSTTGDIQGVFIANQGIQVQSIGANPLVAEKKFVSEGTLAACGNISIQRDFRNSPNAGDGSKNNSYPASLFIFRPDFLTNTPEKMKRPIINWREVAP